MEKLTIEEVIAHCQRTCERAEMIAIVQGKTQDEITSNQYWEHYQVCGWLEELKHYKELEEQGLLVKLPCAFGSTVYIKMQSGDIAEAEVKDFTYFHTCGFCVVVTSEKFDKQNIPFSEFGKTIFADKAQAEQALAHM